MLNSLQRLAFKNLEILPRQTGYQPVHGIGNGHRNQYHVDLFLDDRYTVVQTGFGHTGFRQDGRTFLRCNVNFIDVALRPQNRGIQDPERDHAEGERSNQ